MSSLADAIEGIKTRGAQLVTEVEEGRREEQKQRSLGSRATRPWPVTSSRTSSTLYMR